jgi:hypothetical protein
MDAVVIIGRDRFPQNKGVRPTVVLNAGDNRLGGIAMVKGMRVSHSPQESIDRQIDYRMRTVTDHRAVF